jgi:hypothetical protein
MSTLEAAKEAKSTGGQASLALWPISRSEPLRHSQNRPPDEVDPAFALVIGLVESPAGIEPATPSLPCVLPRTYRRGRRGQAVRSIRG